MSGESFTTHLKQPEDSPLDAYVWGHGGKGRLGLGDERDRHEPVLLDGPESGGPAREWSQIALGNSHSVGVTPKGEVFTWGHGGNGSLGHGTKDNILKPAHVKSLVGKTVTHVCCSDHTVVVTTEGELFTCGNGDGGQLDHGKAHNLSILTRVEGLIGHFVSQVACGDYHTVVLTSDGCVWTFGSNASGRTGQGNTEGYQLTPKKVEGVFSSPSKKVVFIAGGQAHSACITEDGSTYTWGNGACGKLGHGDETDQSAPKLVDGLVGIRAKDVACGGCHTPVCTEDGRVYSFGYGADGQLGHDEKKNRCRNG